MLWVAVGCAAAVVVIWFGYPLVVAGLASLARRRAPSAPKRPATVSVIVATVDDPATVTARVVDILAADYPGHLLEVVVGIDRSASSMAEVIRQIDPRAKAVTGDAPGGKAATLNAAVRAATGEVLVFTDAAQRFDRSAIRILAEALADEEFGAVSGALQIGRDGRPATLSERYWLLEKWLRAREARLHSTVGVTGAVYAMRRVCWHPLPPGLILDDVYGPMHLVLRGYRIGFEPSAIAYDERRFSPAQEFRRKARTLTGVLQLCVWLPAVLVPWRNPIWLQFVFHKLLRLATPYLLLASVVAAAAWLSTSTGWGRSAEGLLVGVALAAGAAVAIAAVPRVRRAASMAIAMQGAVLRATLNGLRGDWDVWGR